MRVHDSQAYRKKDVTRDRISCIRRIQLKRNRHEKFRKDAISGSSLHSLQLSIEEDLEEKELVTACCSSKNTHLGYAIRHRGGFRGKGISDSLLFF